MDATLQWHGEGQTLYLRGCLKENTLQVLWSERQQAMAGVELIDVSGIDHIDSGGLALLVHLLQIAVSEGISPVLTGVSGKLSSLITLYNLQNIIKFQPVIT